MIDIPTGSSYDAENCYPQKGGPSSTSPPPSAWSSFKVGLAGLRQQAGAGPNKQIVLVLDQAGWHTSVGLRVPEPAHLLFLPPYSPPELQPAEHLWPPSNTVLINCYFADLDELEDEQALRCVALQHRRDLIRSATRFS